MEKIRLEKISTFEYETIQLASSKSESNRALIINSLSKNSGELHNLSSARDTQTLIRLLSSDENIADVIDAGTTMRFLTSYFAITNQKKTLTGTPRMCERPIGILVDALRFIGANIEYIEKTGYPPLKINGMGQQVSGIVEIRGDVSSQFISSILMIAPLLEKGLTIKLTGEVGSIPYIKMTIKQMEAFGVLVNEDWVKQKLSIEPQNYISADYSVESDWSGASYWYSILALESNPNSKIELLGLKENSLQGDSIIVKIMENLGVKSTFNSKGVILEKIEPKRSFQWDFSDCPDLAQTVAVITAMLDIPAIFTGLESLKVKETDRVVALQNELKKIGADLVEVEPCLKYEVRGCKSLSEIKSTPVFETYDDHRMAMAFAPIGMMFPIIINEPGVVAKSYPSYWEDISKIIKIEKLS